MTYRWIDPGDPALELINAACRRLGYAELNINPERPTCRVLAAEWDGVIVEVMCFQMFPVCGPLLKIEESFRDEGKTSRELVRMMHAFLEECQARGYLAIADNPFSQRLCERFSMKRVEAPVYEYVRKRVV